MSCHFTQTIRILGICKIFQPKISNHPAIGLPRQPFNFALRETPFRLPKGLPNRSGEVVCARPKVQVQRSVGPSRDQNHQWCHFRSDISLYHDCDPKQMCCFWGNRVDPRWLFNKMVFSSSCNTFCYQDLRGFNLLKWLIFGPNQWWVIDPGTIQPLDVWRCHTFTGGIFVAKIRLFDIPEFVECDEVSGWRKAAKLRVHNSRILISLG